MKVVGLRGRHETLRPLNEINVVFGNKIGRAGDF
jgi:hypothetical protein